MRAPIRIVFEQRGETPKRLSALVPLLSVLAALLAGALFLFATGYSPWETYSNMFKSGLGTWRGFTDTLGMSTVFICTAVALITLCIIKTTIFMLWA